MVNENRGIKNWAEFTASGNIPISEEKYDIIRRCGVEMLGGGRGKSRVLTGDSSPPHTGGFGNQLILKLTVTGLSGGARLLDGFWWGI